MSTLGSKERAEEFRRLHARSAGMLVLPNAWDAASARIIEQVGFPAVATTSSGMATALGYQDGQQISRKLLVEAVGRITRVVGCPVTADIEAGYGASIGEIQQTVQDIIEVGAVGINIEDSQPEHPNRLVDISYQVELISALRELAVSLDVPLVINARTDVFLLGIGEAEARAEYAAERGNAYLGAGADCIYPIGWLAKDSIGILAGTISGPINILGGSASPTLAELDTLGVARVSFGGGLMRSVLGRLRSVARQLRKQGNAGSMAQDSLSGADFESLFL